MPLPADVVRLLIGGSFHEGWISYDVDSDLLVPADGWHMAISFDTGKVPAAIVSGAPAEIRVGEDRVMIGRVDRVRSRGDRKGMRLEIIGRDLAGQLLDCSAPIFTAQMVTLEEVVKRIVAPLGIAKVRIDADNALVREKINVEPGETAWMALQHAAEANGLWPWFEPDGTLVVGGPDYSIPPVAGLVRRLPPNAKGNNILSLDLDDGVAESYSEVTVLSQTHGGAEGKTSNHAVRGGFKDPSVTFYRPRVVVDHESDTKAHADERARKLTMDSRLKRWTAIATVPGHRINAPGQSSHGRLWAPGSRVTLRDEVHGLDMVCFVMGRRFTGGRDKAPRTTLTLKEDGVWIVAAHPHKRRHRRGKNGVVREVDVSKSPEAGA